MDMIILHIRVVGDNMYIADSEINTDIEKFVSLIMEAKEKTIPDKKWYIEYDNDYIHIDLY